MAAVFGRILVVFLLLQMVDTVAADQMSSETNPIFDETYRALDVTEGATAGAWSQDGIDLAIASGNHLAIVNVRELVGNSRYAQRVSIYESPNMPGPTPDRKIQAAGARKSPGRKRHPHNADPSLDMGEEPVSNVP